ncbi:hypothetical protein ACJJTC_016695 [Scirpophaga incertulas]
MVVSISNYIRSNFTGSSEENIAKIIANIQKSFINQFRQRFTKAGRKKDYFLKKRGRPSKTYEDSSVSTKKRKNKELLDTCGLDFILNSYTQGLRARGEGEEALIVEVLRTLPPEKKSEIRNSLLSEPAHLTPYTKDEALGIFIELNLSKAQYENMRSYLITKNCLLFPSYKSIREAKRMCYPPDSSIEITNIKAKIKLQDLLDHTSARLIKIDDVYKQGLNH